MQPKVSILLATYNPNIDWLNSLLNSLNDQDYSNYDVVILDDCSTSISIKELNAIIKAKLNKVPFTLKKNKTNIGSVKTFEKLVKMTDSDFVAFADQDDVWHLDKLSRCMETLKKPKILLTYSDVCVVNEHEEQLASSMTEYRKRFEFYEKNQFKSLIYKNCVIGCTMVARREFVVGTLPFLTSIFHDQYLALCAAKKKGLVRTGGSLVNYRIHQENQTHPLGKVTDKESYFQHNILKFYDRVIELKNIFNDMALEEALEWAEARIGNYHKDKTSRRKLKEMKHINPSTTKFDLYVLHNALLFKIVVKLVKCNII